MSFIWFSRGKVWGSRVLLSGGLDHPRLVYEAAIDGFEHESEFCVKRGDKVVVRFPDPESRSDRSGRVIAHDFVVFGADAAQITSVNDARSVLWPQVSDRFATIWDASSPED